MRFAARVDRDLQRYVARLARDRTLPVAEITRRIGERAEAAGGCRPSYSAVRLLVQDARLAMPYGPSWVEVAVQVATRESPPSLLDDKLAGLAGIKHLPEDAGVRPP